MATATRRGAAVEEAEPGLGDRVREAREERGLSCAKLSVLAGLGQSHVGQIERGEVKKPSGEVVLKIAQTLGVSVLWLLTGRGLMRRTPPARNAAKRTGTGSR